MTRRRWIADEVAGDSAALVGEHAAHLTRVLRVQAGQQFDIACGEVVRRGTVSSVADDRVEFMLGEELSAQVSTPITLLLAVFKFDRMEWAIEKCTELNVTSIVPVIARRTEKHLVQAAEKRIERWRRIARESAQQSRRSAAPQIHDPVKLAGALDVDAKLRVVLAESEREADLMDTLREFSAPASLALAVGPEGGWTPEELKLMQDAGWVAASLGTTILRAETAAIAALAIARAFYA
jgi:16S rRNA (uracil1498-N3)-methyltransferase